MEFVKAVFLSRNAKMYLTLFTKKNTEAALHPGFLHLPREPTFDKWKWPSVRTSTRGIIFVAGKLFFFLSCSKETDSAADG